MRLLVLTGCRKGEILTLRWSDYREGHLFLRDSQTGPRTVWLCEAARDVLDRLPRSARSVFPVEGVNGGVKMYRRGGVKMYCGLGGSLSP